MGNSSDFVGGEGGEIKFVIGEGGWGGLSCKAEEASVRAGAEGDDLFALVGG